MRLPLISAFGLALFSVQQVAGITPPPGAESLSACSDVSVRKEIRSLSEDEWNTYKSAVEGAKGDRWIDWFGYLHERVSTKIHGNSEFFVYHRKFINDYEKILRGYEPNVVLPYWNNMIDYQNPAGSPILGEKYFGGNGVTDKCVGSGIANSWNFTYLGNECLQRNFGEADSIVTWYSPEFITSTLQSSATYADLRFGIENSLHGIVHLSIGGDMNTMHSPADPIFWLHHSNIDRLYAQWQAVEPDTRTYMYDGTNYAGNTVTLDDKLTYTSTPAYEVMRLGYGNMCYTYDTIQAANGDGDALLSKRQRKCKPRPSKATQTIQKLPAKVLADFYPSFEKKKFSALENEMSDITPKQPMAADCSKPFTPPKPSEKLRGKMPYPGTLSKEYIKMMNLNPEEVKSVEKRAFAMVDELNAANYLSPYLFDLD
ncbi:hypothetical protein H4S08_000137 [Coemansia sp. RSA 1365]|nr:hypothetical protein H4S08_000137 [Coemansia sp. RSA 1365]